MNIQCLRPKDVKFVHSMYVHIIPSDERSHMYVLWRNTQYEKCTSPVRTRCTFNERFLNVHVPTGPVH